MHIHRLFKVVKKLAAGNILNIYMA